MEIIERIVSGDYQYRVAVSAEESIFVCFPQDVSDEEIFAQAQKIIDSRQQPNINLIPIDEPAVLQQRIIELEQQIVDLEVARQEEVGALQEQISSLQLKVPLEEV